MSGVRVLLVVAPLRLTFWVVAVAAVLMIVIFAIGATWRLRSARADRRRERVRAELEPVFARFFETEDRARLAEELRPAFMRMDAAHRPVAALLVSDLMQAASWSQREQL